MFAPEVVAEKIANFKAEFGWAPIEHSIEEVDQWSARLKEVFQIDSKGNIFQQRPLTKAEKRFIANERAMCSASCFYFLTRYYYIKAKNRIMRFAFRQGQWILWMMLCELDRMGVSKMLQILKARQLGISTLAEGIATWASQFMPGCAEQIGSADGQKTQIMLGMLTLAIEMLPPWLPPTQTRAKTASDRALLEWSRIGSMIMVQHGAMRGGMGQGSTPTFVHLSECSQFTDPTTQLDEGLFKTLHEGPELVVLLESTGDPKHKSSWWWKQNWITNRDNYWSGAADFLPVFLPWHTTPELYPGPWLKKHPMPPDFQPNQDTIAHVIRAQAYVAATPMLAKVIGKDWKMPLEQQWFWQFKHEDHKRRRVEKSWYRQMPCDDYEALLGENDKVYSQETIEVISKTVEPVETTPVYMLVGDDIPERREPKEDQVWYGADSPERVRTHWITKKGIRLNWMFVPLKPEPEKTFDPLEKFLIWEMPREGYDYSIGADTGTGVGGDRTILNVTRKGSDEYPDYQVAEFSSDSIPAAEIYVYMAALSSLYSRYMTDKPHPKMCIEMKRKFGDLPYHMARQIGFRRWHMWGHGFDRKIFREHPKETWGRVGWFTNEWSRPLILSAFQYALDGGWYVVRSKWLAEEIRNLEQKTMPSGKTRVDHASGDHDDRVFAGAQAYWTQHQADVLIERLKKRYENADDGDMLIDNGPVTQTVVIPGGSWWKSQSQRAEKAMARSRVVL